MLLIEFTNLVEVSFTCGIIILVLVLLSSFINKNYNLKLKYWIWIVVAVRLLLPFNIYLPQAPLQVSVPDIQFQLSLGSQTPTAGPGEALQVQGDISTGGAAGNSISLLQIVVLVWLGGCIIFLFSQCISYFLFKRKVLKWSHPVKDTDAEKLLNELSDELCIKKPIMLLTSDKVSAPMMIGLLKPLLLLPNDSYSDTDLRFILKHELIHFKRHDIWYKLLLLAANAVHWFNPFAYIMFREASKDLELSCDDEVVKYSRFDDRKQYSEAILASIHKQYMRQAALSTNFYGGIKTMKERFKNIFNMDARRRGIFVFSLVLISVALIGSLAACSTQGRVSDPAGVVKKYFEAEKNSDYDKWITTLIKEKQSGFTKEQNGNFGIVSLTVNKIEVSDQETRSMKERYKGSDLAKSRGWSDNYVLENMIVVSAQYSVIYDHTKVPYNDGNFTQNFILVRENKDSEWLIWDMTSPTPAE